MKHTNFRRAAEELQMWANELPSVVKDHITQCRDALENGKHPDDTTPEQMAELILRRVSKHIEDVMSSFDSTLESINMGSRYSSFFRSRSLTQDGWEQFHKLLDEYRDESA